ncbi:MAG: heat-inducible transcriptional repressor [Halieaceae bacterium]|jgi:heat-inducible transcriptional repressor
MIDLGYMQHKPVSDRAQFLLKTLIERHIREGQPIGSKTLLEEAGLPVSAATVRNIMSDLEDRGFITSPHTSAGRIPTNLGYKFFVESLLQVQPLSEQQVASVRAELHPDKPARELVLAASGILASVTAHAGVVIVPRQDAVALRQIEFLPLSGDRVLVILVMNEREVQNRIIHTNRAYTEEELREATRFVNQRYAGRPLELVKREIVEAMERDRLSIDRYMQASLDLAASALDETEGGEEYVVAGESQVLGAATDDEVEKLRDLFDSFERKKDVLHLLERSGQAQGVQIFIGQEAGFEVFNDYSVVTAPYQMGGEALGVLGVIGPTRMAYDRVVPIVDLTARMLGAALAQ